MELYQLEYFVAVAEMGSFSRAAERCLVAQPSLSQQIAKLERELGRRLFDRLGRRVSLTDAGRSLLERAHALLLEVASLKQDIRGNVETGRGRLAVGAIPTIAPYVLPEAIGRLRRRREQAELTVMENLTEVVVEQLVGAELDVGLLSSPLVDPRLAMETLWTEPLLLAVGRDHPLANAESVSLAELERYPAIVLHEMHCLGQQIDALCRQQRLSPRIVCHTTQLGTIQSLVALGLGVSLVPQMCADADRSRKVIYVPFAKGSVPSRAIVAAWHPLRTPSPLVEEFLNVLRENRRESVDVDVDRDGPGRDGRPSGGKKRAKAALIGRASPVVVRSAAGRARG